MTLEEHGQLGKLARAHSLHQSVIGASHVFSLRAQPSPAQPEAGDLLSLPFPGRALCASSKEYLKANKRLQRPDQGAYGNLS